MHEDILSFSIITLINMTSEFAFIIFRYGELQSAMLMNVEMFIGIYNIVLTVAILEQ
jgi:hypothetical protein